MPGKPHRIKPVEAELPSPEISRRRLDASPFVPLHQPIFRAVWLASLVSNFGGLIQAVAASVADDHDRGRLPSWSPWCRPLTTLPVMLSSLPAGAISDNYDRRLIMLIAQVFMFAASTALAVAPHGSA